MHNKFVLDLKFVAWFSNQNASKATGIENRGQVLHVLMPCEI